MITDKEIQTWIDNRFGYPNTVNLQVFKDFAKYILREDKLVEEFRYR